MESLLETAVTLEIVDSSVTLESRCRVDSKRTQRDIHDKAQKSEIKGVPPMAPPPKF